MKAFWLLLTAGISLTAGCEAQPTAPKTVAGFSVVSSFADVPTDVRAEVERRTSEPISDVGGPFNATDIVDDRPTRRFVVAGHAVAPPDRWLLCYEHGGHGYHYHVVLLERTVSGSRVIEAGQWLPPAEEIGEAVRFESVVEGLRTGEVAHDNHW